MRFHHGPIARGDQALELAVAHALVKRAGAGAVSEVLRVHRTTRPVTVFGRRETRLPGFRRAVEATREAGFEPLVRATGGRAVAYTGAALVIDHVRYDVGAARGMDHRFQQFGAMFVEVFRSLGVDARLGAVPGEYCPGAYSVNARGVVKLVGTSQRLVRNAWLFSSLVIVGDETQIRPVLAEVYAQLGEPFDQASVGSLSAELPSLNADSIERAVLGAYAAQGPVDEAELDVETLALASELVSRHRVDLSGDGLVE